jgi:hypothetical protein
MIMTLSQSMCRSVFRRRKPNKKTNGIATIMMRVAVKKVSFMAKTEANCFMEPLTDAVLNSDIWVSSPY